MSIFGLIAHIFLGTLGCSYGSLVLTSLTSGFCAILAISSWLSTNDRSYTRSNTSRLKASFYPSVGVHCTAVHPSVHDSASDSFDHQQCEESRQADEMTQGQSGPAAARDQPVGWQKHTKPQIVNFVYHALNIVLSDNNQYYGVGRHLASAATCSGTATIMQPKHRFVSPPT